MECVNTNQKINKKGSEMHQNRRDMLEAVTQDLDILAERYNYAHKGINMAIVALKDEPITKLMDNDKIDEFVNSLDYARIQTIMNSLDWGYRGSIEAPSIDELRRTARYVILHALDTNSDRVATGGFVFHNTPTYKELCFKLDGMEEWGIE